jgi:hypothetical protein
MPDVRELFASSPKEFRPVPWWAWTGDMTREGMDRQLLAMHEQGIYEFFIFAVYGLDVEFNSDAYFDLVAHTLRRCREWGLKAWIYDDLNWPSGICGGKVLRDHPWTCAQLLRCHMVEMGPSEEGEVALEGRLVNATFVGQSGAVAALSEAAGSGTCRYCNGTGEAGRLLAFEVLPYKGVFASAAGCTWTWNQPGYLDVLNPEAVRVFIDYCYEPYAQRFAEYLGKEIPGFFTDEPGMYGWYGVGPNAFPWTDRLPNAFQERYGYSLEDRLAELVAEVGNWHLTRTDYWRLVTDLFAESFTGQIDGWCRQHGMRLTGHYAGEETIRWNVSFNGDIHQGAKRMSVPGIDFLGDQTPYDITGSSIFYGGLQGLNITAKQVSSTADYTGAERRMVEAYGVVDWDQSLARMKRVVDWLAAMGLNLINDNTLIYSLQGFRKRRASGKTFPTPWFRYYDGFSEHVGRVCYMTTVGRPVDEVAVLYPTTAAWALYGGSLPGSVESVAWPQMEAALVETCDALNRIHRGWKFLYDEELANARIEGERLVAGGVPFRTVILPALPVLGRAVAEKVAEFARAGGQVLLVGGKPFLSPDRSWDIDGAVAELMAQKGVADLAEPAWGPPYEAWLSERIANSGFVIDGQGARQVLAAQRHDESRDYLFLTNQMEQPAALTVSSQLAGTWERWDPNNGRQWAVGTDGGVDERSWSGTLAPFESIFLVISRDPAAAESPREAPLAGQQVVAKQPLIGPWQFERLEPNALLLDLAIRPDRHCEGLEKGWQSGKEGEWLPTQEGRTEIKLDPDELPCFWLRAELDLACVPADLELVLDSRDYGDIFINGYPLSGGHLVTIWDEGNWAYPLREHVLRGRNVVVLRCRPSRYYAERVRGNIIEPYDLEPVVVRGSFAAFSAGDGHLVVAPETGEVRLGAWERQGYPAYCGTGLYRRTIDLPAITGRCWLQLEDVRHVAEVEVNGRSAGVRLWAPYEFELTEHLRPGPNEITVRVTNGFGRLMRRSYCGLIGHEVLSGIVGRAWLVRAVDIVTEDPEH